MKNKIIFNLSLFLMVALFFFPQLLVAQDQDVPEPVFSNFSIQPLYIPTYHGRDPFKPLSNMSRLPTVSISELDYHGVIEIGNLPIALFTWRGNSAIEYTLKYRKLYSGDEQPVDGVVGNISPSQVVLMQGGQKMVYPRN